MKTVLTKRKGQSLVETIVALSVLVVGFMGLITLLSRSFAISNFVSENYVATYLAAEGIEVVRDLIEHNYRAGGLIAWNEGLIGKCPCEVEWSNTYLSPELGGTLFLDIATGLYDYDSRGVSTKFTRTIYIDSSLGPDRLRITSAVKWDSSGGITGVPIHSEVNLEDHFFDPYPNPNP
ncbi:MAG: hypothetical protein A3B25_00275 [Candidatus Ryanbacteria bacterium RIFCSPLOWO2_01_FULL_48_26]|uniref:Type 4 fimbrial biogenesis protein PilX N-terminal domain-containing protein n=1 Tax=Candidatus Ryanbacteria bacterium RIFCSPLOWO2_01_FULL_48_26 TaxID=1802126 RepID=A0A1G2GRV9_9BACT|nr:MAG: hypothetical protein A3B25_00275 [Candidatus Ryanbacteria bacterium RIFCSPLOWO2_01_FULL_48_26]OHB22696.1 MAG: hypothetical protein A3J67_06155 [Parcubacteria group bacterium RIFCSPHIGHO2_02_FULL_48_10b]